MFGRETKKKQNGEICLKERNEKKTSQKKDQMRKGNKKKGIKNKIREKGKKKKSDVKGTGINERVLIHLAVLYITLVMLITLY